MRVIGVGPFVGDFETEVLSFRPYVTWLFCNIPYDKFLVSSHYDRRFLYHWIPEDHFIEVLDNKDSDLIIEQQGYYNNKIDHVSYLKFVRRFRNKIFNKFEDVKKDQIKIFTPHYTKLNDPVIPLKKQFSPIFVPTKKLNYILYEDEVYYDQFEFKRLKDAVTYKEKVEWLSAAKCVVCEAGLWTIIANIQGVPVFSWSSESIAKYKQNGTFWFGNKNFVIYTCNETLLKNSMKKFLENIYATI